MFLSFEQVCILHQLEIDKHGGASGFINESAVIAVVHAVEMKAFYASCSVFELAAAYGYKLTQCHGFRDGNKRVGASAMLVFLMQFGIDLTASNDELVAVIMGVAQGQVSEAELARWLVAKAKPD
ncbi:MAG: type II toxin-antitoxin system death-on-curing family toxin [Candidatus Sericytochromatia bacterium]|nr:type II toxin-antitoxin system death-on-curing family toxin [Candidatus Sericytochromatia bacterium]